MRVQIRCGTHGWREEGDGQDECPSCEIARLRTEVGSKTKAADWFRERAEEASAERDEALAQVAALYQAAEGARHPDGMPNEGDIQFWYERLNQALADTPVAARALLDRLDNAEVVVKALKDMINVYASMAKDVETLYDDWAERAQRAEKVLTTWEEGKA